MPPKSKGPNNGSKQRTVRCRDDERIPGSCARGSSCRFLHSESEGGGVALSHLQSSTPETFGFGKLDLERYRQAAVRIAKLRTLGSSSLQSIQNDLKDLWCAIVGNLFPSSISSTLSLFQCRIDLQKLGTKPAEWVHCFNSHILDPSFIDAVLSQLILQRDFALGLLGVSVASFPGVLNFLAVDPTFLHYLKAFLASPTLCPHQPNSCLPHIIRNLIKSEPFFLEIMFQLLPSFEGEHDPAQPRRIKRGSRLCHILQYTFGFDTEDLKPLYLRLLTHPLSSSPGGCKHSGEWRAVDESPPQRYNLTGEPLGQITKYCVDDEENEGCSCMHRRLGPDRDVLRRNHWSCCGGSDKFDMVCVNASSASKLGSLGLQCSSAHPMSVRVHLPSDSPIELVCARCGLDCQLSSCVSAFCALCKMSFCLACSELMSKSSTACLEQKQSQRDAVSSAAGGRAVGGGGAASPTPLSPPPFLNDAGVPMKKPGEGARKFYCGRNLGASVIPGSDGRCGPNNGPQCPDCKNAQKRIDAGGATKLGHVVDFSMQALMDLAVASFVDDCQTGAGWALVDMICGVIDNQRMDPHDIHTIRMLLMSLNIDALANEGEPYFDQYCCRSLAGALATALARQHSVLIPDREIPLDLRVIRDYQKESATQVASSRIRYLQPFLELVQKTKRFVEFSEPLVQKIHRDHPTPVELISLIEDKQRLLVELEVAYFQLKHPSASKKGDILRHLLEMGCFPRKFAVKAAMKSSRVEDAVNFFFSHPKTASDEDESEDAELSRSAQAAEALKSFVSVLPPPAKDSSDKVWGEHLPNIAEIEAKIDFTHLLSIISSACSSLELFADLKKLTDPIMKNAHDRVEAIALQQKTTPNLCDTSEFDRRLFLQSFLQNCTHLRSMESLHCFAGHPLVQQECDQMTRCAHCSKQLHPGSPLFSCKNPKLRPKPTNSCDCSICMPCVREQIMAQSAHYSPFDIATCIRALERLIPHGKFREDMKGAFSSVAGNAELAFAPVVPFGWKSPEIPQRHVVSGDICGPDCTTAHDERSAICIRCDRRFPSHKGHQCNDGERGYFISSESHDQGQSPSIDNFHSGQRITMHHSSARPVSLVHSEPGTFAGKKWTCTLVSTGERGQNTWIGLCDADVVAEYSGTENFKGLGTKGKGFSIGFHHELGVRVEDKTSPRSFACKDGDGISIEYDEAGRKVDVIISKKVVYTHAGLPPNLMFAISSGDKKSKFTAMKCRQVDVPLTLDAHRSSLLERISKAISSSESWNSDKVFSLLSLLTTFRTKPHYVLSSKCLRPSQETLVRIIAELIEHGDINTFTSRTGACDAIFSELAHIADWSRKPLLLVCVAKLKSVSIALLQGRNSYSLDSLGFLSKLYAVCSKGFAHTTALAFDYLIKHLAYARASKSNVDYVRLPRWVIEAIDPSRSFLSIYRMFGACFPAMLHAGWVDVETKDGKLVRLSCEAAQVLLHRHDNMGLASDSSTHALTIGPVSSSINNELAANGLWHDLQDDCDMVRTPLQTASLPLSIHIGSCCIDAVAWFKTRLYAQDRLEEIGALAACCKDTGSPPAVVQLVLTDLVRRTFVIRKNGFIMLADAHGDAGVLPSRPSGGDFSLLSPPPSTPEQLVCNHFKSEAADALQSSAPFTNQPVFGALPHHDLFKVTQAVFFTVEDSAVVPSPWTSSLSSASSVSINDFEIDLADTLYGLQNLEHCDDVLKTARRFEECSGSVTAFVFKHDGGIAPASYPAIIRSVGFCPICLEDDVDLVCSPCGHLACCNCYHILLQTAISDSGSPVLAKGHENLLSVTAIKCMADGCEEHLPLRFLQEVVPDLADVTKRILVRTLLRILNNSTCPISSCLCGQSMLIGNSQDCEAICARCGRCATIGDFKRKEIPEMWLPHPTISSDEVLNWNMLNDVTNSSRRDLMRFKGCPHCGTMTTRCGCDPAKIVCDNLERCPNEKCDHIDCTVCKKRWCWVCGGPSCPTKCAKPALQRTHRKEKFVVSQNAIMNLAKASSRCFF